MKKNPTGANRALPNDGLQPTATAVSNIEAD
jgi:hypothetical protein